MTKIKKKEGVFSTLPDFTIIQKYIKTDILRDVSDFPKAFDSIIRKNYEVEDLIELFKKYKLEKHTPELLYFFFHYHLNLGQALNNAKNKNYHLLESYNKGIDQLEDLFNQMSPKKNKVKNEEDYNKLPLIKTITFEMSDGNKVKIESGQLNIVLMNAIEDKFKELKSSPKILPVARQSTSYLPMFIKSLAPFVNYLKYECGVKQKFYEITLDFIDIMKDFPEGKYSREKIKEIIKGE